MTEKDFVEAVKQAIRDHAPCVDEEGCVDEGCEFYIDISYLVKQLEQGTKEGNKKEEEMKCASFDKGEVACTEEATVTVFWPGKETVACDRHHAGIQRVAAAMGFAVSHRPLVQEPTKDGASS